MSFESLVASEAACYRSGGIKRDKLKGTNGAKFAVVRRFSLIFADFLLFLGITAFRKRRFSQKTAGNRRFSQKPVCPI